MLQEGNNLAGLSIEAAPLKIKLNLFYYTKAFYSGASQWWFMKNTWKNYPAYVVWDSSDSEQAFYCWFDRRVPQPKYSKNTVGGSHMDVVLNLEGIIE